MIFIFFTVDRIINDIAVLLTDNETMYDVNIADIPFEVNEGDVLTGEIVHDEVSILRKDTGEMQKRSERINDLFEKLKNKNRSE